MVSRITFETTWLATILTCSLAFSPKVLAESKTETPGLDFLKLLSPSQVESKYKIEEVRVIGLEFTKEKWIFDYLGLKVPGDYTQSQIDSLKTKLFTTNVFFDVKFRVLDEGDRATLEIKVEERWTMIPVVRFALGGGTPLTVLGFYDSHAFGRLWTLGVENRRYGDAPGSWVFWANAPRWLQGDHLLGFEVWKLNGIRSAYDRDDVEVGRVETFTEFLRTRFLAPLPWSRSTRWQIGIEMKVRNDKGSKFRDRGQLYLGDIDVSSGRTNQIFPTIIYDNVSISNLHFDGVRILAYAGALNYEKKTLVKFQTEGFYFKLFPNEYNLAFHHLLGKSQSSSPHDLYFLGGFDSVRGLPDGVMYGQSAGYLNTEVRKIMMRTKYLWLQGVGFVDQGGAGKTWSGVKENWRSAAGIGLRFAVPKIYRMIFRFDYAWSLDKPGTQGVSLGMNHFFQPYRPLDNP